MLRNGHREPRRSTQASLAVHDRVRDSKHLRPIKNVRIIRAVLTRVLTSVPAPPARHRGRYRVGPADLGDPCVRNGPKPTGEVSLTALGTYDGGGLGRAEIVAFSAASDRMAISNDDQVSVDIVSIVDPTNPTLVASADLSRYGDGVNGVAASVSSTPNWNTATGADMSTMNRDSTHPLATSWSPGPRTTRPQVGGNVL